MNSENLMQGLNRKANAFAESLDNFYAKVGELETEGEGYFGDRDILMQVLRNECRWDSDGSCELTGDIRNLSRDDIKQRVIEGRRESIGRFIEVIANEISLLPVWENMHISDQFKSGIQFKGCANSIAESYSLIRHIDCLIPTRSPHPVSKTRLLIEEYLPLPKPSGGREDGEFSDHLKKMKSASLLLPSGNYILELLENLDDSIKTNTRNIYRNCMNRGYRGGSYESGWGEAVRAVNGLVDCGVITYRKNKTSHLGNNAYRKSFILSRDFQEHLEIDSDTVNRWAKGASVETPTREDDAARWPYFIEDAIRILEHGIDITRASEIRSKAELYRNELEKRL